MENYFIIIEVLNLEYPYIICDEDNNPLIFKSESEAVKYADELHDPIIVRIF